ncbi:MAG: type VI secretion system tip protein TssI/VgrG [Polyangiaceae bacterium]
MGDGLESVHIGLRSEAAERGELLLLGVRGADEMNGLYELDLVFGREKGPLRATQIDALFAAPCAVSLGPTRDDLVRGVLSALRQVDTVAGEPAVYVARLVPTAALLTLSRTNRIFHDLTVPELAASVLSGYGLVPGKHFRVEGTKRDVRREYIAQYQESDWDFLQRWLEHDGLSSWFEQTTAGERLVIAEAGAGSSRIAAPSAIGYRARSNKSTGGEATIWAWEKQRTRVSARSVVFDYNYRAPHVRLVAKAVADPMGFGTVMDYGGHFSTTPEAERFATIRAEAIACRRLVYTGETDTPRVRAGHVFEFAGHHDEDHHGAYLVTRVDFSVGAHVPAPGISDDTWRAGSHRYAARFTAVPSAARWRPELRTPKPRIHGVMNGHIDSDAAGEFAQIDEQGRYQVSVAFDSAHKQGVTMSRWIRMAQPYAGPGYGAHHPLHRGTEVLVAYVDGDPDRPVIVGAAPNPRTISPSTRVNPTQSVTESATGVRIEMEDWSRPDGAASEEPSRG